MRALLCLQLREQIYDGPQPVTGIDPDHRLIGAFHLGTCYEDDSRYGGQDSIVGIEVQPGFSPDDMLRELAILELRAFGAIKHGRIYKDGDFSIARVDERTAVDTPISRQQHEQLVGRWVEEWCASGSWVRDEIGG